MTDERESTQWCPACVRGTGEHVCGADRPAGYTDEDVQRGREIMIEAVRASIEDWPGAAAKVWLDELHREGRLLPADARSVPYANESEVLALIEDRDVAEGWADYLAEAIAKLTGVDIGEHSSGNDPWANAAAAAGVGPWVPVEPQPAGEPLKPRSHRTVVCAVHDGPHEAVFDCSGASPVAVTVARANRPDYARAVREAAALVEDNREHKPGCEDGWSVCRCAESAAGLPRKGEDR